MPILHVTRGPGPVQVQHTNYITSAVPSSIRPVASSSNFQLQVPAIEVPLPPMPLVMAVSHPCCCGYGRSPGTCSNWFDRPAAVFTLKDGKLRSGIGLWEDEWSKTTRFTEMGAHSLGRNSWEYAIVPGKRALLWISCGVWSRLGYCIPYSSRD